MGSERKSEAPEGPAFETYAAASHSNRTGRRSVHAGPPAPCYPPPAQQIPRPCSNISVLAFGRQRDFTNVLCDLLPGDTRITIQNYANDSQAFLNIPPRVANLHRNAVRKAGSNSRLDACQFPLERRKFRVRRQCHDRLRYRNKSITAQRQLPAVRCCARTLSCSQQAGFSCLTVTV